MRHFFHAVIILFPLFAACGGTTSTDIGGDGGATHPGGGTTVAGACADVAKARCQRRDACTNGVGNQVRYGDEAACETRETANCVAGLGAPRTGATPESVEGCAKALPSVTCTDFLSGVDAPACEPKIGTGAAGTPCLAPAQCASAYCATAKNAACGTCAPAPKAGDSCAVTGTCGTGLACTKDTSVCVAEVAAAGECGKDNPCGAGFSCVGATRLNKATCQPIGAAVGADCDPSELSAPACDRTLGLFCDPTSKKCAAATFAKPGEACGVVDKSLVICSGGGACQTATAASVKGTCAAPIADGAPCDPTHSGECLSPARCVVTSGKTGTCQTPDPASCQ